jgi:hypothetical protein
MGRWTSIGRRATLGVAWVAIAIPTASADLVVPDPPKSKRVPVVETVDWGVFQDRLSRPYVVVAGDTLRRIAAAHCGDAARWKVLVEANPALAAAPDRLRVGDVLWLPPVGALAPAPTLAADADPDTALAPWYDAFAVESLSRYRMRVGARYAPPPPGPAPNGSFLLVPHSDAAALLAALAARVVPTDDPLLARAMHVGFGHANLVHEDEGTVRIEVTTRLSGRKGNAVTMERQVRRLDAAGRGVSTTRPLEPLTRLNGVPAPPPADRPPNPPPEGPPTSPPLASAFDAAPDDGCRWPGWLGLLVAGVGAAIVGGFAVGRRRRSAAA